MAAGSQGRPGDEARPGDVERIPRQDPAAAPGTDPKVERTLRAGVTAAPGTGPEAERTIPAAPTATSTTAPEIERCLREDLAVAPGVDPRHIDGVVADVVARLSEPQRHYHDARHVLEVRAALAYLGHLHPAGVLAAWLHDIVYDPAAPAGANEAASAETGRELMGRLGVDAAVVTDVTAMIEATATHRAPDGPEDALAHGEVGRAGEARDARERLLALLDADLWILAAPRSRFDEYCAAVRAEYRAVPDATYAAARTAILTSLADGGRIYALPAAQPWETAARANLAVELARLSSR